MAPIADVSTSDEVVVIGGGTMGRGIAQVFAQTGYPVTVVETDDERAQEALNAVEAGLARWQAKHAALDRPSHGSLAIAAGQLPDLEPLLVIESVPELADLKLATLSRISAAYPRAVIASNTSAISIDFLADAVLDPARFLGLHFFNPVPRSALVEVVRGSRTGQTVVDVALEHIRRLGLTPIEVRDSPGFATSRLGIVIGLEAIRMVEEQVASAADIDRGMVLGYRFPMGPLELSDLVGLDVRLAIAEHLRAELGDRFEPPRLLRAMVADGRLGAKAGEGFYRWDTNGHRVH
jgi:3-hydroxybutyryl-CoA dehydrogenase